MRVYGLIGHPVSHSFSKTFFENKFIREKLIDCRYELFDLETISDIKLLRESQVELCGLNVTAPYKQAIIPYLEGLSEKAKIVGAVNTIKIKHGKWFGYNSDVYGFYQSLLPLLHSEKNAALILGSGGAARAVKYVLENLGIPTAMVSRTLKEDCLTYTSLDGQIFSTCNFIINTTPLGMHPLVNEMPAIPISLLGPQHTVFDLIYNPEETLLLKTARLKGSQVKNGLEMLHLQAEKSWEIWNE